MKKTNPHAIPLSRLIILNNPSGARRIMAKYGINGSNATQSQAQYALDSILVKHGSGALHDFAIEHPDYDLIVEEYLKDNGTGRGPQYMNCEGNPLCNCGKTETVMNAEGPAATRPETNINDLVSKAVADAMGNMQGQQPTQAQDTAPAASVANTQHQNNTIHTVVVLSFVAVLAIVVGKLVKNL